MTIESHCRVTSAVLMLALSACGGGGGGTGSAPPSVSAPPVVTSLNPSSAAQGETLPAVLITGSNFQSGATCNFGAGITVSSCAFNSATQLTANITISSTATAGTRDVTVSNPDNQRGTLPGGLSVTLALPAASTLSVGFSPKLLQFTWTTASGATSYRLLQTEDGVSALTQVGADIAAPADATNLDIGVHLQNWQFARFALEACNDAGCTRSNEVTVTSGMFAAIGYIKASNTEPVDLFGYSVALSGDGNTLAVSAVGEDSSVAGIGGDQADNSALDSGAVYVFTRRSDGVWSQQGYIKASNTDRNDSFGSTLALSGDGNTLAVGAEGEDFDATGIDGNPNNNSATDSGAVYVFTRRADGVWSEQAYIKGSNTESFDLFGISVALSVDGDTLAVGAVGENSNATGIGGNQGDASPLPNAGAVYVFTRSTDGVWSNQTYIKASNTGAFDLFGVSVALNGDGDTLAVGAKGEGSNARGIDGIQSDNSAPASGAVYVFTRPTLGVWSQQAYIKASNTQSFDVFGTAVSLSSDGDTLAVSALGEASDATGIGSNQANNSAPSSGAVYAFTRAEGVWSQQAYIKASNTDSLDLFGSSVALSGDGHTLAVGAQGEDSDAAAIDGNPNNDSATDSGAMYMYTLSAGVWSQHAYVKASNTSASCPSSFGRSGALSGDGNTLAVGAVNECSNATGVGGEQSDASAQGSGAVYLY